MIDALSQNGEGRSGSVTVPFAMPGETVEAVVTGQQALVSERIVTSPDRNPPVCPHFGLPGQACGGCTLQHLGVERAVEIKAVRLLAAVVRSFPGAALDDVHVSPPKSRRRAKLAVAPGRAGLRAFRSRNIVRIQACDVLHPDLFAWLRPFEDLSQKLGAPFEVQVTLTKTGADLDVSGLEEAELTLAQRETIAAFARDHGAARISVGGVTLAERQAPVLAFGGVDVELPGGVFLQATAEGEAALQGEVLAGTGDASRVADLYSGVGTFALPLSERAEVFAVDAAGPAIAALGRAATRSGRPVETEARDLLARPLLAGDLKRFDAVVFDPPRAGAGPHAPFIAEAGPASVIAVSCNPATLARDLMAFRDRYHLSRLVLVDQFGWSPHLEAVAVLKRR